MFSFAGALWVYAYPSVDSNDPPLLFRSTDPYRDLATKWPALPSQALNTYDITIVVGQRRIELGRINVWARPRIDVAVGAVTRHYLKFMSRYETQTRTRIKHAAQYESPNPTLVDSADDSPEAIFTDDPETLEDESQDDELLAGIKDFMDPKSWFAGLEESASNSRVGQWIGALGGIVAKPKSAPMPVAPKMLAGRVLIGAVTGSIVDATVEKMIHERLDSTTGNLSLPQRLFRKWVPDRVIKNLKAYVKLRITKKNK